MTEEPKPNRCEVYFRCPSPSDECYHYIWDRHTGGCMYFNKIYGCHNPIAQTNSMVTELQKRGVRI